jgi:glutamate dehydrogenase (NAD(P)+)
MESILNRAFDQVVARAARDRVSMRIAATSIGVEKVLQAKRYRGLFP